MFRFYLSIVVLHYLQKCVPLTVSKTLLETYIILALRIHSLAAGVYVPLLSHLLTVSSCLTAVYLLRERGEETILLASEMQKCVLHCSNGGDCLSET